MRGLTAAERSMVLGDEFFFLRELHLIRVRRRGQSMAPWEEDSCVTLPYVLLQGLSGLTSNPSVSDAQPNITCIKENVVSIKSYKPITSQLLSKDRSIFSLFALTG